MKMRKIKNLFKKRSAAQIGIFLNDCEELSIEGYTPLSKNPEIIAGARKIAELIGSTTIHLMQNTKNGDERIINELSRAIDIEPMPNMTRQNWIEFIIMTLLIYGKGNAIVVPKTKNGYLASLEPISASRVSFQNVGYSDYKISVDGKFYDPGDVLHFVYNPDKVFPWKGTGVNVQLQSLARNLAQASETERKFLSSKWKPSLIVKVDALTEEFSSPEGRQRLADSYLKTEAGEPWIIPAEQFQIEQVRPLTLADLAIKDTIELDKKTVASILGVPSFLLGVGEYDENEWNTFINTKIKSICLVLAQEMTKKLILSPKWYIRFNIWSLLSFDIEKTSNILLSGADRGYINGDTWRDRVGLPPAGLTEYKILENYIPYDMSGMQKKLK